jgi:hypothetical protein
MAKAGNESSFREFPHLPWLNSCLVAAIVVYPFIGIWQWGDFTDLGWICMEIQNFHQRLDAGRMESPRFLSFAIGAAWWHFFSSAGILGLLMFACALIVLASLGVIFALKNVSGDITAMLLATLAAQAFYVRNALQFDYDVVSLVFSVWSAAFVVRALSNGRLDWMFFAGVLAALAAASRTPSVVLLGLVVLPFFNVFQEGKTLERDFAVKPRTRIGKAVWQGGAIVAGFVACLVVFVGILWANGLWQPYVEGFAPYLARKSAEGSGGAYDIAEVIHRYLKEAALLFPFALVGLLWGVLTAFLFRPGAPRFLQVSFSLISLAAICAWVVGGSVQTYGHSLRFLAPGFYLIVVLAILMSLIVCDHMLRTAIAAGCLLCIASFAGSNAGLLKLSGGLFFLVPACTAALVSAGRECKFGQASWGWQGLGVLSALVLLVGSASARATQVYHAANDWLCRYRFVYTVENVSALTGMRTTENRAAYLSSVIPELTRRIGDEPVYVYGHTPMIYSLLNKDSFIPEIWFSNNVYSADFILSRLQSRIAETGLRPSIIVTEKTALGEDSWQKMVQFLSENSYARTYAFEKQSRPYDAELWQVK